MSTSRRSCLNSNQALPKRLNERYHERPLMVIREKGNRVTPEKQQRYWRANLRAVLSLLTIWAIVGFGCSIFFIEPLNQIRVGKIGLGFWFAQQGSIFCFVALVLGYAIWMDRLDRQHDVGDKP